MVDAGPASVTSAIIGATGGRILADFIGEIKNRR